MIRNRKKESDWQQYQDLLASRGQLVGVNANRFQNRSTLPPMIRGVNLGGWLVLERWISPYVFAITDCHARGDLCWHPGQLGSPYANAVGLEDGSGSHVNGTDARICPNRHNKNKVARFRDCQPLRRMNALGVVDYPMDEYTLGQSFYANNLTAGTTWLDTHFDHFVTRHDLRLLKNSGITHVRVPLPHWILYDQDNYDQSYPWIVGHRWQYFVRMVLWCRELGLQVWPDIHTAPGSQNGFDNGGQTLPADTCWNWSNNPAHVQESLRAIDQITAAIGAAKLQDVVTGFMLLNEPFLCDHAMYLRFVEQGRNLVLQNLGPQTAVYVHDMFEATTFQNYDPNAASSWWVDAQHNNTYLDSHYYQVFAERERALSPRQHIAETCQKISRDLQSCCFANFWNQPHPTLAASEPGVKRLVSEWSAAFDALVVTQLSSLMEGIAKTGVAPNMDRTLSAQRRAFMEQYVKAQMVVYEAAETGGLSGGWFYWTLKMEGGTFAEWDFLRGIREGWIPTPFPEPHATSEERFGSCYEILLQTDDDWSAIHELPDPRHLPDNIWRGPDLNDDVVVTHGDSLLHPGETSYQYWIRTHVQTWLEWAAGIVMMILLLVAVTLRRQRRRGYSRIASSITPANSTSWYLRGCYDNDKFDYEPVKKVPTAILDRVDTASAFSASDSSTTSE